MSVIAGLSEEGWISDPNKILDRVMSYYILTDSAQTLIFQGNLTNLPDTYHLFINDPTGMANQMQIDLERLVSRYFASADVTTEVKQVSGVNYAILFYVAAITEEGARIEFSKVVEMTNEGVKKVINVSNYGNAKGYLEAII